MKLQKDTIMAPAKPRWYDDACGAAHGLELLGERWALLIVRELMFGPRRFGAIREALSGISAKVLTERLQGLKQAGIVAPRTLPPPASTPVYELTPWGYEAEPIFSVLGRWAARSPSHDPALPLSAASLMLSFRTMFDPAQASGFEATIGFRFDEDAFRVTVSEGELHAARADPVGADAVVGAAPPVVAAIVYGGLPLADAEASGQVSLEGDRDVVQRFAGLFPLPGKAF
jgi:DNA-binding HxlR family transcriptional regulator/putative sterol carrier protein